MTETVATVVTPSRRSPRETAPTLASPKPIAEGGGAGLGSVAHDLPKRLALEEAQRMRIFAGVGVLLIIAGILYHPLVAGFSSLEIPYLICLGVLAITLGATWWRLRLLENYSVRMFRVVAVVSGVCGVMFQFYAGMFSTSIVVLAIGIVFLGSGDDRRWGLAVCGSVIAVYGSVQLLVVLGLVSDPGIFSSANQPLEVLIFTTLIGPSSLAIVLWQARLSRTATRKAVNELGDALAIAHKREAQLEEAYAALKDAKNQERGRLGRFTGYRAGAFELHEIIGRGAMGEVYAAVWRDSERAAVKVLLESADEDHSRRFQREGEILQKLDSPHVVHILDVGRFDDSTPYLAMELLTGTDLASLLQRESMRAQAVVDLIHQVAVGLEAAHNAGVIHRDIKPHNLFRCDEASGPRWKILDFGVSRFGHSTGTLTEGAVVGTPGYMSPEQAQGLEPDHRADVFSLGAVAYRCITGQRPFRGPNLPEFLYDIVYGTPAAPTRLVRTLHPDVDNVIAIALAKDPEDRFSSAALFADAFERAIAGRLSAEERQQMVRVSKRARRPSTAGPTAVRG